MHRRPFLYAPLLLLPRAALAAKREITIYDRKGSDIVEAPAADQRVARGYDAFPGKGHLRDGYRVTILTRSLVVKAGDPVRVIHVLEAPAKGRELWVMGPKTPYGELVDGVNASGDPPVKDYPWVGVYDGAVLQSPGADYNWEITSYTFSKGTHTIQWKPGNLESNVLEIEAR